LGTLGGKNERNLHRRGPPFPSKREKEQTFKVEGPKVKHDVVPGLKRVGLGQADPPAGDQRESGGGNHLPGGKGVEVK